MSTQTSLPEIQTAAYAKLTGDATLMALLAAPLLGTYAVFDFGAVPENQPFPYLTLGNSREKPQNTFGRRGYINTFTVDIWDSQFGGFLKSQQILARMNFLLDQKPLTLGTQTFVYCMYQGAMHLNDPGEQKILHTPVDYEYFTQE